MMIKSIVAGLGLSLALSAPVLAGGLGPTATEPVLTGAPPIAQPAQLYNWTGPYAGVTLGYGAGESDRSERRSGLGAGLHLGYNYDFGSWVSGIEAEFAPGALAQQDSDGREIDSATRLKLRAGPKFGPQGNSLAFGTLGFGHTRSSVAGTDYRDTGWLAGAGVSHALRENLLVTGEVIHHRVDELDGSDGVSARGTTGTVGLSLRF